MTIRNVAPNSSYVDQYVHESLSGSETIHCEVPYFNIPVYVSRPSYLSKAILASLLHLHYLNIMCHTIRMKFDLYKNPLQSDMTRQVFDGIDVIGHINKVKYHIIDRYCLVNIFQNLGLSPYLLYSNIYDLRRIVNTVQIGMFN